MFQRGRSRVLGRGIVRVLVSLGCRCFSSLWGASPVRPGLTFELAPGFIVWGGGSGGTGSNKRKYRTRRVKIGKGVFDRNHH